MKLTYRIFVVLLFVFLTIQSAFAQNDFVVSVVEFEVINKDVKSNQIIDSFQRNTISNLDNFTKIFNKATKQKLIKINFKQSKPVSNGETSILTSEGKLDLINNKKIKIGEVLKFDFQITPTLLDKDSDNSIVSSNLTFERNSIDKSIPPGERFVVLDRRFYKTSINSNFGQVTVISGGKTPNGSSHFLAIYFER